MSTPELRTLSLLSIRPHPINPRFDLGPLDDLAADIAANGLIEPLIVVPGSWGKQRGECIDCGLTVPRRGLVLEEHTTTAGMCPGGSMEAADAWFLVAGHRRHAAATMAGLTEVQAVARFDLRTDADVLVTMLRENIHRHDLTVMEEGEAYQQLTLLGMTATRIAHQTKRSRKTVERRLALVELPEKARKNLHAGTITLQDAEALLGLSPEASERALKSIGTRAFREAVVRERGFTGPAAVAAELRAEFLGPFLSGAARPTREALPLLRREVVASLAARLPRPLVRGWLESLGVSEPVELTGVDPDRALLALAVAVETDPAGQYDLLGVLGYEPTPVELELLEGA